MLLAFIPARGGSKGIPQKNLALLAGKPLIHYTLEAARRSHWVDEIFISTDDDEIASYCQSIGVEARYRRPASLASDTASTLDALVHGLQYLEKLGNLPKEVAVLQPTSPLRTAVDIDNAIVQFRSLGADTLLSAHPMTEHPFECITVDANTWKFLAPPPVGAFRRQDYKGKFLFINGAIYLAGTNHILAGNPLIVPGKSAIYEMPANRGIDIDTPMDLAIASALLQR